MELKRLLETDRSGINTQFEVSSFLFYFFIPNSWYDNWNSGWINSFNVCCSKKKSKVYWSFVRIQSRWIDSRSGNFINSSWIDLIDIFQCERTAYDFADDDEIRSLLSPSHSTQASIRRLIQEGNSQKIEELFKKNNELNIDYRDPHVSLFYFYISFNNMNKQINNINLSNFSINLGWFNAPHVCY